jgi:8-oxo-dGTP pyrophosphatase MutT (NUDIX family)
METRRLPGTPSSGGTASRSGTPGTPSSAPGSPAQGTAPATGAGLVVYQASATGELLFLLLRSRHGMRQWSFPKGHFAANETGALTCALRETEEETGIAHSQLRLVGDFRHRVEIVMPRATKAVPSGRKRIIFFLARAIRGVRTRLSPEHSELVWVSSAQASRMLATEQRELLARALVVARADTDNKNLC